jgi:two-component system sensor histidine kinase ArlS
MKIRTKLALRFTIIVASILIFFALSIYYFSSSYREQEFYSRLKEKANNTAKLLIDVDEVSSDLLKIIDRNTASLPEERIVVYDYNNKEVYNSTDNESSQPDKEFLNAVRLKGEMKQSDESKELLGILFKGKYDRFVVIASANDKYGFGKIKNLRFILIIGLLVCVFVTMIAGWSYAGQALNPISNVVGQVDKITASNLNQRVNEGNGTDEIAQLSVTFNRMLDRIEEAFKLQKSFVSNASHELRTPLTSITGQLEVALIKKRSIEEYEKIIGSALEDINSLSKLTNGLLILAQVNMDVSALKLKEVRIDELLWLTRNELHKSKPSYKINIEIINVPENEKELTVLGSEQLLKSAILNLMDNACKFSPDKQVFVTFSLEKNNINLTFRDKGFGISENNLKNIFEPFYRGDNAKSIPGHGLGLSLTQKIIALHKGDMDIKSKENNFTIVAVSLPTSS